MEKELHMDEQLMQFRKRCNEIYDERRNNVKFVLENWLESFISVKHLPWKAIEGKEKLRPISIHRNFSSNKTRNKEDLIDEHVGFFRWPDLPDEEIMNIIKGLGFNIYCRGETLTLKNMSLAVPATKKGEPLTFAQKWVKKMNDSYSKYVAEEKCKAKTHYNNILRELSSYDSKNIRIDNEFIIFENYESELTKSMSQKCHSEVFKLLNKSGISIKYNPSGCSIEAYVPLSILNI